MQTRPAFTRLGRLGNGFKSNSLIETVDKSTRPKNFVVLLQKFFSNIILLTWATMQMTTSMLVVMPVLP